MLKKVRLAAWTFALCGFGAAAGAEVSECTVIASVPYTINAPGIYCLKASLSFAGAFHGGAITVQADDVVIDLNGHVLSGPGPESPNNTWGVRAVNRKNITVRNGTIRAFLTGVGIYGSTSPGHLVEHLRLEANMDDGLNVSGAGTVVRHNRVIRTGGPSSALNATTAAIGMNVFGNGAHVTDNEVVETVADGTGYVYGIQVGGVGAMVERNVVANAALGAGTSYGILVFGSRSGVNANRVVNVTYGLYLYGSGSNGLYRDNNVGGTSVPFVGGTAAGATNFSY